MALSALAITSFKTAVASVNRSAFLEAANEVLRKQASTNRIRMPSIVVESAILAQIVEEALAWTLATDLESTLQLELRLLHFEDRLSEVGILQPRQLRRKT